MQTIPISRETPMWSLEFDHKDWQTLDKSPIIKMHFLLLTARRFEETISDLDRRGLVHDPAHSSIGQEGGAAAA
jgi:2-oxoisovalerate dehydrogenase E1 component